MFDFNCDIAQGINEEEIKNEFEMAEYVSSINISCGLYNGNPLSIKKALDYASQHEKAVGALISYDFLKEDEQNQAEKLEADILYQISVISSWAHIYGLNLEYVRCFGELGEKINYDSEFALQIAGIIRKFSPWLTLVVGNFQVKEVIEKEIKIKCAYEVTFDDKSSIRELREMEYKPETVHFATLENAKRAHNVIKPTPFSYNRVALEI